MTWQAGAARRQRSPSPAERQRSNAARNALSLAEGVSPQIGCVSRDNKAGNLRFC